jgi:hypothetical protein
MKYDRFMNASRNLRLPATFIGLALYALAQIDGAKFASDLHTKYAPPLARETFSVPAGEMVIDYAANGHVCKIQLPPAGPDAQRPGVTSTQAVDDFLLELVPLTTRGKELRRWSASTGMNFTLAVEYENVVIAEGHRNEQTRTGVTVTFLKEQCVDRPVQ